MRRLEYDPALDGVRALAVATVMLYHGGVGWTPGGFLGVDVFFVLSGFLITTLLLRERQSTGRISLKNFYVRRSLRIFPLYYAVLSLLVLYFLLSGDSASQGSQFFAELPYHATYTSNWVEMKSVMAITWSLSTEEQFYLVWPPMLALLFYRTLPLLLVFLLVNQALNFGALDGMLARLGIPYADHEILQSTLTPIILGVLLSFVLQTRRGHSVLKRWLRGPILWVAVVLMLLAANMPGDIRGWPRLSFHVMTSLCLAGVVLQPSHRLVRALEWRPLVLVGVVSYGIYLLHMLVRDAVWRVLVRTGVEVPEVFFVLCLVLTVVASAISYRTFERPILRLKDRFR